MAEKKRNPKSRRTYVPRPNAIHVTVYSPDGRPVPKSVLNQAADAVTDVALRNGLLVGLAET
jgi:hypothetical protein